MAGWIDEEKIATEMITYLSCELGLIKQEQNGIREGFSINDPPCPARSLTSDRDQRVCASAVGLTAKLEQTIAVWLIGELPRD